MESSVTHTSAAETTLASFGYTRGGIGQLASTTPTGATQGNESYPYTQLNQLAGVNTSTYSNGGADNLTKLANGTAHSFDAANQLTAATTAGPRPVTPTTGWATGPPSLPRQGIRRTTLTTWPAA